MVVTEMRFDTTVESPKLVFKPKRWLTDEEYVTVQEKGQSPEAVKAVEFNVGTPAAPSALALEGKRPAKTVPVPAAEEEDEAPAPKPRAAAKKAAPKVEEAAEDEGEEPVVRKPAAKASSVPAKTGLADIAAAWDDED
jgi:hypothetical protein